MFKWFKNLFNSKTEIEVVKKLITIAEIDVLDTVWIKDGDSIIEGWVFNKTKKSIVIVTGDNEYIFHYKRPFTQTEIEFNKNVLYFNKPC